MGFWQVHLLVQLTGFCGQAPFPVPRSNPARERKGGVLIPSAKQRCNPLGHETVDSWWSQQANIPQFIKFDV